VAKTQLTRRHFLKLAGSTVGLGLLAGCVPAVPESAPAAADVTQGEAPAEEGGALWVLHNKDFHPGYNDYMRNHIVSYADDNGLTLDVAFTAGFQGTGADIQKLAAAVQAGDPPDVWIGDTNVFQLHALGTLQPVTEQVQEVIGKYGEINPRPNKETFLQGEYVGLPLHARSDGGWARQDLFEAAGIDIGSIRLFDELRDACLAVSKPDDSLWGWGITVNRSGDGGYLVSRVLNAWGAFWADETGEKVTIDSDEAVQAVEWLADTYSNPKWEAMLPPGVLSWTDSSNNEAYLGETVAYTQNAGTVFAKAVQDGLPVEEVTVYHPPAGGPVMQEFNGLNSINLLLIKGAKNPREAVGLMMSFFDDEVMEGIYTNATAYAVPAYETMWDWEMISGHRVSSALKAPALDPSGWNGLPFPGPTTAQMGAIGTAQIHLDMVLNVVTGQMSAAESVRDAHEKSVEIFKEFGAAGE